MIVREPVSNTGSRNRVSRYSKLYQAIGRATTKIIVI